MSTAIVPYTPDALAPVNLGELMTLAGDLAASGLFTHLPNKGAVAAVILKGHELGLSPMSSLTEINVIKGKISVSAAAMVGVCVGKRDVCEYFTLVEATPTLATWKTKRRGSDEVRHSFSMEDAQRMGLSGNDNYKKQPATMLRHRAASALARMVYPDLLVGCYAPEEVEETPAERITVQADPAKPTGPAALGLVKPTAPAAPAEVPEKVRALFAERIMALASAETLEQVQAAARLHRDFTEQMKTDLIAAKESALARIAPEHAEGGGQ